MKRRLIFLISLYFWICFTGTSVAYQESEIVYFDYPIPIESYTPYNFNGRNLGAPSTNGRHAGEDVNLSEGTSINVVGEGTLRTYKQDGGYPNGYGELYGISTHQLNRPLKVVIGDGGTAESNVFMFIYGHIRNKENRDDENGLSWPTGAGLTSNLNYEDVIGYINDDAHNGDGAEHLHLGVRPDHDTGKPYGYEKSVAPLSGYSPAHMVIAASRIGVFVADSTHAEPYWNNNRSQAFSDVWWEKNPDGTYKFMDLNNYHNKLGRPNNNHPNAPNEGTDFAHLWESSTDSDYSVYVQDMLQPYEGHSRFGDDGKSIIILNDLDTPYKAYALTEGFYGYYKENDGPYTLGMPFTNDIVRSYANSPHILSGDPIQTGDSVTVRKFKRVYRTSGGDLIYNNERKTLIWKDGISVQEFGVGEFYIDPETCSGVCPQVGDQVYVVVDSNPANDIPWPTAGVTIPTGIWFTKPGTYNFVLHNTDGSRKTGWQMTAVITEGNQQSGGGNGGYVYNRSTICQTVSSSVPLGKSYSFYPEDNYVGIWFELKDVYESLDIGWKWYKPNGDLYGECEHITSLPSSSFNSFKAWRFFDVSGMTDLGTWRVELHINGTKVDTQYFSLTEYSSGGGSTPPPDPPVLLAPTNLRIIVQ